MISTPYLESGIETVRQNHNSHQQLPSKRKRCVDGNVNQILEGHTDKKRTKFHPSQLTTHGANKGCLISSNKKNNDSSSIIDNGKKIKAGKTVQFNHIVEVRTRPSITKEDIHNLWYSEKEYSQFKNEVRDTLLAVIKVNGDISKLGMNSKYCTRGIENQIAVYIFGKPARMRRNILSQFLSLQGKQSNPSNPMFVMSQYKIFSRLNCAYALKIASIDAIKI